MKMWLRSCLGALLALGLFWVVGLPASADPTPEPHISGLPSTLPPSLFLGRTAEAYGVAAEIPEVLAGLACYCGCDRSNGHRHLLDCFADDHGAG